MENENNLLNEEVTEELNPFDGWDDVLPQEADEFSIDDSAESSAEVHEESSESVAEDTTETTADTEQAEPTDATEQEKPQETYQFLETKYNKESRTFDLGNPEDKDTVVRLVQKGQNYDKVLNERDTLRAESAELKYIKDALDGIRGDFGSVYDLLDDAVATKLIESEAKNGRAIDKDEAIKRVKLNRETVFAQNAPPDKEEQRKKSIREFAGLYPKLNPQEIPKSVWDEFHETGDLVTAYRSFEYTQRNTEYSELQKKYDALSAAMEQMKLNEKNRSRSTGSQKSTGNAPVIDPELEGWND